MRRTRRRAGPVQRTTLEAIVDLLQVRHPEDPISCLFACGPDFDSSSEDERVMASAWPDIQLAARRHKASLGCPYDPPCSGRPFHGCEYAGMGEEIGCRPWFEQDVLRRREVSGSHRRRPA